MSEQSAPIAAPARSLSRDWKHYLFWWWIWLGLIGPLVTFVDTTQFDFWKAKVFLLIAGTVRAAICAGLFTVLQNVANAERAKWKSWVFAIVLAAGTYVAFVLLGT